MYGYGPMTGARNEHANFANYPNSHANAHALANRSSTSGTMDDLKAFMDKETMGVKNKFLIGGALVLGVGYYGYTKGWF